MPRRRGRPEGTRCRTRPPRHWSPRGPASRCRRILAGALEIEAAHGLSYWDSAIVAAARALGCGELFSEDLPHGREVDGVRIVDPFR